MKKENTYPFPSHAVAQPTVGYASTSPKSGITDSEMQELYLQALRSRYQKAVVFWPWRGDRLSPDQIQPLKQLLQSEVVIIFLPIKNNQSQWSVIVLATKKSLPQ